MGGKIEIALRHRNDGPAALGGNQNPSREDRCSDVGLLLLRAFCSLATQGGAAGVGELRGSGSLNSMGMSGGKSERDELARVLTGQPS